MKLIGFLNNGKGVLNEVGGEGTATIEQITEVAYYGITMKDRKPKFHTSFNPESYLYGFNRIDKANDVVVCTDLFQCVKSIVLGKQAVSTFGLPYLSNKQLELLNQCLMITVFRQDTEIVRQVSAHYNGYVRFI